MIVIFKDGKFIRETIVPEVWNKVQNYRTADPSVWYADGWREVIYPPYDTMTQKLGDLKWVDVVGGDVTFEVVDLPEEEVKQRIISNAKIQKEQFTRVKIEKQVETELQSLTDDADILDNQAGYPLWPDLEDSYSFSVNEKVKDFDGLELKIYKVIQAHNKHPDWRPILVPALFVKVLPPGAALIWEPGIEVTVGQDYEYQGSIYTVIQSHTTQLGWEPPVVPSLWSVV